MFVLTYACTYISVQDIKVVLEDLLGILVFLKPLIVKSPKRPTSRLKGSTVLLCLTPRSIDTNVVVLVVPATEARKEADEIQAINRSLAVSPLLQT